MRLDVTNILSGNSSTAISFSGTTLSFPSQPCFSVDQIDTTQESGGSIPRVIRYQTVFLNVQNGYNITTGRFTAPQLGLYFISFSTVTDGNLGGGTSPRSLSVIRINGVDYLEATQEQTPGSGAAKRTLTASCLMYLSVNDYVEIASTANILPSSGHNTFSGYYIGI